MTPDRWAEVERLYHAASARPAGERAVYSGGGLRRGPRATAGGGVASGAGRVGEGPLEGGAMAAPAQLGIMAGTSQVKGDAVLRHAADDDLTRSIVSAGAGADQFHPGDEFGAYRVVRLLGRGGMGEVYEAEHLDTHRRMALKVLNHTLPTGPIALGSFAKGSWPPRSAIPTASMCLRPKRSQGTLVIVMELVSAARSTMSSEPMDHAPRRGGRRDLAGHGRPRGGRCERRAAIVMSNRRTASSMAPARSRSATSGSRLPHRHRRRPN